MPNPNAPNCGCNWLERSAKDPSVPIVFNELMNEYHLQHDDGRGYSLFYHCPFCGGKVPDSLRESYFTDVSDEESFRLEQLTKGIKTPEELFEAFGQPDEDFEICGSITTPGSDDNSPETEWGPRKVVFKGLSDTLDVHVKIDRYDRLRFSYQGRYIGPARSE